MPIELPNQTSQQTDKIFGPEPFFFEEIALQTFLYQYTYNALYGQYANAVGKCPKNVKKLTDIPFLPINFFKTNVLKTTAFQPETVFESSGTTQTTRSRHYLKNLEIYRKSFLTTFQNFYGPPSDWAILGLLPSYLERGNSSLVFMVDELIRQSKSSQSGFYLHDYEKLSKNLQSLESNHQKTLLIGVTYALLDFAEAFPLNLHHTVIMETGGMKGRKEELTREQIHNFLKMQFGTEKIHSEYGMTELLSQAYSFGGGIFNCPPWMKILLREDDDPFKIILTGTGVINVIDLANIYSCSFIATDDVGKIHDDGRFEVSGRLDEADLRGCSLLTV